MVLVSREMLTDNQWVALRDAPQFVILAVAASGGSRLDLLLERTTGGELDLYAYRQFTMDVARAVAEAAREDDFLGLGGYRVSDAERTVIAAVSQAFES